MSRVGDLLRGSKTELDTLISLIKGKRVFLGCHWDADGVTSGGMIYHLIKPHAKSVHTVSKGHVFLIEPDDIPRDIREDIDYVITADIQPSDKFDPSKVIYIDHHPYDKKEFAMTIHEPDMQSCSIMIWDRLIENSKHADDPYFVFLSLVGYFGDGGKRNAIPAELQVRANDMMPRLMKPRNSYYGNGTYLPIETYVSLLNIGKRAHWSGDLPLSLVKDSTTIAPIVNKQHHLINELEHYRSILKGHYSMSVDFIDKKSFRYGVIECMMNVQGVLCARHMNGKPIIVLNKLKGKVIGSMRVPDDYEFDAGAFLEKFTAVIPDFEGGGHEKAGGFSLKNDDLDLFLSELNKSL